MDWESLIRYGLIGAAVAGVMTYLNKSSIKEVEPSEDGITVLRMNKFYQYIGWGAVCIGVLSCVIPLFYPEEEDIYLFGIFALSLFGGLGAAFVLYGRNHWLEFNDESITVQNWKGKAETVAWNDIKDVRFNTISGYVKISGPKKTLNIHMHLVGLRTFLNKMEEKTEWKVSELKLPIR